MSETIPADSDGIERAANVLCRGGIVAFPTETVYGLGANAFDAKAVARVFEIKRRPEFDPLIVHLASTDEVERVALAASVPPDVSALMKAFWPGALTIILSKAPDVPLIVTSGLNTVGVRVPSHPVANSLIRQAGVPIAAPSANPFGALSPTRAEHVRDSLGDAVDLILDGGATTWGVESTVVSVGEHGLDVLRYGAVTVEQLQTVVSDVRVPNVVNTKETNPSGPGQLAQHYSPDTHLTLIDRGQAPSQGAHDAVYIAFSEMPEGSFAGVEVLSYDGDLREAAARLFDVLHRVDAMGAERIIAERVPNYGLGCALNDRLTRAAARWS